MSFFDRQPEGGMQRPDYEDFVQRYEQGKPWEGISDQEALSRYRQVVPQLPRDEYVDAAQQAFARLTPDQRQQFLDMLRQGARQQSVNVPDLNRDGIDDRLQEPRELAEMAARMEQQRPGLLEQLLGASGERAAGGGSSPDIGALLNNPLAKAALAGIAAMAARRFLSGGGQRREDIGEGRFRDLQGGPTI
jgi:hypothetical protein